MTQISFTGRIGALTVAVGLGAIAATPAAATATYQAMAMGSFVATSITGGNLSNLLISGSAMVFDEGSTVLGDGTADFMSSVSFVDNSVVGPTQTAQADGSANPTPDGTNASSFALTDGVLAFENLSQEETFIIDLVLDYSVDASANVMTNDGSEDAFASATVDLSGDASFFTSILADTLAGNPGGSDAGTFDVELTLGPGEFAEYFLLVDAEGEAFAIAAVPVAVALPLMAVGLLGLGLLGRRRAA